MFPRILNRVVEWVKAHKQFGLEFEERGSRTWVFVRTWRKDSFYRVAVGVIDRYYGDASRELVVLGQVCVQLVAGHLWCPFLGVTHPCGMLQGVSGERIHARTVGLTHFRRQVAQTLPTKDCFNCVRDAQCLFND